MKLIKKYPNRKLYDTETSIYIALDDIITFMIAKVEFNVIEVKTQIDITNTIIFDAFAARPDFKEKMGSIIREIGTK